MLLWLDDKREAPPGFHWAKTAGEAARTLTSGQVIFASLDHDLGLTEPNGYELVMWMARSGNWPLFRPGVHSANRRGAANMIDAIIRYGPYR